MVQQTKSYERTAQHSQSTSDDVQLGYNTTQQIKHLFIYILTHTVSGSRQVLLVQFSSYTTSQVVGFTRLVRHVEPSVLVNTAL